MPKDYTPELVGEGLKDLDPSINLDDIKNDPSYQAKEEEGEIMFVQIGLSVLSGFIFGFIWLAFLWKSVKAFVPTFKSKLAWLACTFVPFASIFFALKANKQLRAKALEMGAKPCGNSIVHVIFGVMFPILPLNIVSLALLQKSVNNLYRQKEKETAETK